MKRKDLKVSVVIACYNHGRYINEAVDSILKQTYQHFEIIIVDDGSTDKFTINKLKEFNNFKIKVIRIKNSGPANARNIGIKNAKGKYILILDADDKFEPTFLKESVNILDKNIDIGVVTCGLKAFENENWKWMPKGGDIRNFLLESNCIGNALLRKVCWSEVGGYNINMKEGYEDWDFWISILEKGWKIFTIKKYLFLYRINNSSRNIQADKVKLLLVKKIVNNHKETYLEYLEDIVAEKLMLKIFDSRGWKIISFLHNIRMRIPLLRKIR